MMASRETGKSFFILDIFLLLFFFLYKKYTENTGEKMSKMFLKMKNCFPVDTYKAIRPVDRKQPYFQSGLIEHSHSVTTHLKPTGHMQRMYGGKPSGRLHFVYHCAEGLLPN